MSNWFFSIVSVVILKIMCMVLCTKLKYYLIFLFFNLNLIINEIWKAYDFRLTYYTYFFVNLILLFLKIKHHICLLIIKIIIQFLLFIWKNTFLFDKVGFYFSNPFLGMIGRLCLNTRLQNSHFILFLNIA